MTIEQTTPRLFCVAVRVGVSVFFSLFDVASSVDSPPRCLPKRHPTYFIPLYFIANDAQCQEILSMCEPPSPPLPMPLWLCRLEKRHSSQPLPRFPSRFRPADSTRRFIPQDILTRCRTDTPRRNLCGSNYNFCG